MANVSGTFGWGSSNQQDNSTGSGTSLNTLVFDPKAKAFFDSMLGDSSFDKSAAVNDAQSASNFTMRQILQNEMPGISSAAASAGGYNSTTKQMLTDDLASRASSAGANVILDNIRQYASIRAGNVNTAANAARATAGTNTVSTSSQTSNQQNQNSGVGVKTVICTQLYRDGHITREVYAAEGRYALTNFSAATIRGYHFWAVPFVQLMRKNHIAYTVGKFIGVHWSNKCAGKFDAIGTVLHYTLRPACWLLGCAVSETDWTKLYARS